MPLVNSITRRDLLGLTLVLLIAAIMRLTEPGIIEFLHDEAYLSLLAQDWVAGGPIPFTGIPSSVGIPNPPISLYIMAIPYALSASPVFATMFIAALNVAGVGLLWLMAQRYIGRRAALLAGLAYALNPWAVLYSRKIWAQDFHTPFVLLGLLLGLYGFVEGKRWAQVACLPMLFLAFQIHFAAWALLPLYLWLLWRGRHNRSWLAFGVSGILAAATLAPFLIGLSRTLEAEPYRITNAFDRQTPALSADAFVAIVQLSTGLGLETWVAPEQQANLLRATPPVTGFWFLIGAAALVGLLVVWRAKPLRLMAGLLSLWVISPLLLFTPGWTEVYPHYFTATIPALSLLTALGVTWLADCLPGKPMSRTLVLSAFGMILLTQGFWWRGLLRYVDSMHTPAGFGTPIHYLLDVRDALSQDDDVLVISDGFEALYDQEPAAWPVLLRDTARCVRTITGDGLAVFPDHPFAVLIAPNAPENPLDNLYQTDEPATFVLRPGAGHYTIHRFERAPAWTGPPLIEITPVQFDSGAQLTGYRLQSNRMYLEWRLSGRVSQDYHYFGHFLDGNGEKVGQRDNMLWPGRFWCEGDRIITWADIDLPAGVRTLRVGLYTLEGGGFANSSVLDGAGNPAAPWIDIPLQD
jgi:fucose 4-O-acetylase-like acetyltransferase